eukprot:4737737-Amphidinium_carterae.1
MPSPATNITSRHKVTINRNGVSVCGRLEDCSELGRKQPPARARCPKRYPCAKTLRMAKDCHKTWHQSVMAKHSSSFGVFVQLSIVAES